jgi:hypothetical protein
MTSRLVLVATTVNRVEERSRVVRGRKTLHGSEFDTESLGWFVLLSGISVGIGVGKQRPALEPGDAVRLIIEKD